MLASHGTNIEHQAFLHALNASGNRHNAVRGIFLHYRMYVSTHCKTHAFGRIWPCRKEKWSDICDKQDLVCFLVLSSAASVCAACLSAYAYKAWQRLVMYHPQWHLKLLYP